MESLAPGASPKTPTNAGNTVTSPAAVSSVHTQYTESILSAPFWKYVGAEYRSAEYSCPIY